LVIPDQVRLIDLMPTLLALSGVSNDQTSQGRDVGPLLRGDSLIPEPALAELLLDGRNMRALRTNHNKFISYDNHRNEFFDLDIDPYERHPLPPDDGQYPKVQRELRLLTKSAQRLGKYLASDAETETKIDLAMCRRLRALGYIESSADCNTNLTN
jgi:arylsulfatase A-like enzyme